MKYFLPEEIKELRLYLGLDQTEFGSLVGCTKAAVCRWENGDRRPLFNPMVKLNEVWTQARKKQAQEMMP